MPPKASSSNRCVHTNLVLSPSRNAFTAGYKRSSFAKRVADSGSLPNKDSAKTSKAKEAEEPSSFPAPLVLPEDALSWDPKEPPQSFRSWIRGKHRNKVNPERRTVYFVGPPQINPRLEIINDWAQPRLKAASEAIDHPRTEDVLEYLEAFYHGLPVKMLSTPKLHFTADLEKLPRFPKGAKGKLAAPKAPDTLWLNTNSKDSLIGIRARATPKGDFSHQLNLNDLLDAAIEILPDDAYALLMLVEHDLYEDEEDEFACGRAYGGSRIAVVSSARYNPGLDEKQNIERDHAWPASHCKDYMASCCNDFDGMDVDEETKSNMDQEVTLETAKTKKPTPIEAALAAHASLPALSVSPSTLALYDLWLGRVCRTAAHELGHCFGIAHCPYYACSMQGTASIIEDSRQPPYLCPIDLEKVVSATGTDIVERYKALLKFCDRHSGGHLFAAYAAWMRGRIKNINDEESLEVV